MSYDIEALRAKYGVPPTTDSGNSGNYDIPNLRQKYGVIIPATNNIPPPQSNISTPEPQKSLYDRTIVDPLGNFAEGFAKSELNSLQNIGNLVAKPLVKIFGSPNEQVGIPQEKLNPTGTAQELGGLTEKTAEFFVPQAKALRAPGYWNLASQAIMNGGIGYAQTGSKTSGAVSAGLGALFALPAPLIESTKPTLLKVMKFFSGYNDNVVSTALERTPGAVEAVKNGEHALNDVVRETASGLSDYANKVVQEAKDTVKELNPLSAGGKGFPGTRLAVLDEGRKFASNIESSLRNEFNVGVTKEGELLFNRSVLPSNIVSGGDQKAIQDAFSIINGLKKDTSISNIDAVIQRMINLKTKTPIGSPTGAETKKIIGQMITEAVKFTESLDQFSPAYQKYADFLQSNLPQRVFVNDAKELFGATKNLSAKETSQIATRILQMFNSGKSEITNFAEKVGQTVGTDIKGTGAGSIVEQGDTFNARASNLTKRGVIEKIGEAIPRATIKNYIKTGNFVSLEKHPIIQFAANLFGTTAKAIVQEISASATSD